MADPLDDTHLRFDDQTLDDETGPGVELDAASVSYNASEEYGTVSEALQALTGGSVVQLTNLEIVEALAVKADKVDLPTAGNLVAMDADGNLVDSSASVSSILGQIPDVQSKADKSVPAVDGNLAALDASGNLADSGYTVQGIIDSVPDPSGKADKVTGATAGNLASLDEFGNLTDSGSAPTSFDPAGSAAAAQSVADAAQSTANQALDDAGAAGQAALQASNDAAGAQSTANDALGEAQAAQASANQAIGDAATANGHIAIIGTALPLTGAHKITSGEVAQGYFEMPPSIYLSNMVHMNVVGGPGLLQHSMNIAGETGDFDVDLGSGPQRIYIRSVDGFTVNELLEAGDVVVWSTSYDYINNI